MINQKLVEDGYLRRLAQHELPPNSWQAEQDKRGHHFYEFVSDPHGIAEKERREAEQATHEVSAPADNVIALAGRVAASGSDIKVA